MTAPNSSRKYACSDGSSRIYKTNARSIEVTNISAIGLLQTEQSLLAAEGRLGSLKTGGVGMII